MVKDTSTCHQRQTLAESRRNKMEEAREKEKGESKSDWPTGLIRRAETGTGIAWNHVLVNLSELFKRSW